MTTTDYLTTEQPHGTTATAANTGASVVQVPTGGTAVWDDSVSFSGKTGVKLTVGNTTAYLRFPMPTVSTTCRVSAAITLPSVAPGSTLAILGGWGVGDVAIIQFCLLTTGSLVQRVTSGSSTNQTVILAAGELAWGQRIRIEVSQLTIAASGSYTVKVYDANTLTQIGATATVTGVALGTAGISYWNVGVASANGSAGMTAGIDTIRLADDAGSELGPYWPAGVTPALPERLSSNAGGWTSQGGAASFIVALNDANDTTFLRAPGNVASEVMETRIAVPVKTGVSGYKIAFAAYAADNTGRLKVDLVGLDGTIYASRTVTLSTAKTTYEYPLTASENAAIANKDGLRLRFTANPA